MFTSRRANCLQSGSFLRLPQYLRFYVCQLWTQTFQNHAIVPVRDSPSSQLPALAPG